MSGKAEWLRTFVAVYRTGSVTVGARSRGLSQPAASQQLAALSRAVGGPVFARSGRGVVPTDRGRRLYAQVAEPLDQLEGVLTGLDRGVAEPPSAPVRIGASAEVFEAHVLPLLSGDGVPPITAAFGDDAAVLELLLAGEVDVTLTAATAGQRSAVASVPAGGRRFALVAAPALAPRRRIRSADALGAWLSDRPWVSYSRELPVTRRFWRDVLGRPFDAELQLVAPDLRVVAAAVEDGMGVSLLPTFVCRRAMAERRVVELFDVEGVVAAEPWFASTRRADAADPRIAVVLDRLTAT